MTDCLLWQKVKVPLSRDLDQQQHRKDHDHELPAMNLSNEATCTKPESPALSAVPPRATVFSWLKSADSQRGDIPVVRVLDQQSSNTGCVPKKLLTESSVDEKTISRFKTSAPSAGVPKAQVPSSKCLAEAGATSGSREVNGAGRLGDAEKTRVRQGSTGAAAVTIGEKPRPWRLITKDDLISKSTPKPFAIHKVPIR